MEDEVTGSGGGGDGGGTETGVADDFLPPLCAFLDVESSDE